MVKVGARLVTEQEMGRDRARKRGQQSKKRLKQRFQGLVKWGKVWTYGARVTTEEDKESVGKDCYKQWKVHRVVWKNLP